MPLFEWSSAYQIHIPEFDAEHRTLFRLAGDLHQAAAGGAGPDELQAGLQELAAQVAAHFSHEERRMRSARYPAYAWHKKQHDIARARLTSPARGFSDGERDAVVALLQFLAGALKDHIALSDRMMAAHLRNHARAHAALAS